jgi:hypothetical protein
MTVNEVNTHRQHPDHRPTSRQPPKHNPLHHHAHPMQQLCRHTRTLQPPTHPKTLLELSPSHPKSTHHPASTVVLQITPHLDQNCESNLWFSCLDHAYSHAPTLQQLGSALDLNQLDQAIWISHMHQLQDNQPCGSATGSALRITWITRTCGSHTHVLSKALHITWITPTHESHSPGSHGHMNITWVPRSHVHMRLTQTCLQTGWQSRHL